jgi:glycerol-3-phosphate dehydrogenase (NAD(P)+)
MMDKSAVAVVGGGPWGLALASCAARAGRRTLLASRREVNVCPTGIELCRFPAEAISQVRLVILAIPSSAVSEALDGMRETLTAEHIVIHGARGLVGPSLGTVTDVVREQTRVVDVGALGGPALAADLLSGAASVIVCGTTGDKVGHAFVQGFAAPSLRIYTTNDLRGVEWSSALVGCLAMIVGYAQHVGLGAGSVAALVTRGVQEVSRMVAAAGGAPQTPLGLAGLGDVLACVSARDRPEVRLGAALATGMTVEDAARTVAQNVEGVNLLPRVVEWARTHKLRVPIFSSMADRVFRGVAVDEVVSELMSLPVEDPG